MGALARLARFAQPLAQAFQLGDHLGARIGRGVAANRLHHRREGIHRVPRGGEAMGVEFGRQLDRVLQPLLERVRDVRDGLESRGTRAAGERVRGAHEPGAHRMQRVGFDRRHLRVHDAGVLLGLAHVDREERLRDRHVADGERGLFLRLGKRRLLRGFGRGLHLERGCGGGRFGCRAQLERFECEGGRGRLLRGRGLLGEGRRLRLEHQRLERRHRGFGLRRLGSGARLAALQGLGQARDLRSVDACGAIVLQLFHPARERGAREVDEGEEVGRGRLLVLQPLVHHLLALPTHLAQVHEAHHAAAALERVEAAADGGERFAVVRRIAGRVEVLRDGRDDLARLLEEDLEQLLVDLRAGRVDQLHHLLGGLFRRLVGYEPLDRLVDAGLARILRALQRFQRRLALLRHRRIGNHRGVALEVAHRLLEAFARVLRGRFLPILVERLHFLLLDVDVERRHGAGAANVALAAGGRGLHQAEAQQRRHQHLARRGRSLLQRGDVKAQRRQPVGHHLGGLARAVERAFGELLHARHHRRIERGGVVQLHDHERALHLRELRRQRGELAAPGRVAEEVVERRLDVLQVHLHFLPHLEDQQLFLRAARHLVEEAAFDRVHRRERLARHRGAQPLRDGLRLAREVGAQLEVVLEGRLDEEHRGGHLERLRFRGRNRLGAQRRRDLRQAVEHCVDVAIGQAPRALGEDQRLLGERFQRGAVARGVLQPRVLLLRGQLAHFAQHRVQRVVVLGGVDAAVGHRDQLLEAIDLLQQADALGHGARAADGEEQVAEEPLCDLARALDHLLHLLVELREDRLHARAHLDAAEDEPVEEGRGRGPERTVAGGGLQRFDRGHRRVHLPQRFGDLRALQHLQKALLVQRALVRERLGEHAVVERGRGGDRRQLRAQIGEEEIAFVRVVGPARVVQLEVGREEPHRMVDLAAEQRIEVGRERRDALLGRGDFSRQV